MQIIVELAQSPEARERAPAPALDEFVKRHSVPKASFWSRLRRPHLQQLLSLEQQLRALDNRLYVSDRVLGSRLKEIAESMLRVRFQSAPAVDPASKPGADMTDMSFFSSHQNKLPLKLSRVFVELRHAIAARR